jgi:hypothetical protein
MMKKRESDDETPESVIVDLATVWAAIGLRPTEWLLDLIREEGFGWSVRGELGETILMVVVSSPELLDRVLIQDS